MVIYCHASRCIKVNSSLIGRRYYELQIKLCFCYPKVIHKIAFRFWVTLINIFCSEFL